MRHDNLDNRFNSLDFLSAAHLHVEAMWFLNDKAVAGKLYLRMKILRWLSGSAYFVLVGTGGLHAGEAKPSSPPEWERTVEAAKKEGKVVVSVPASAELRRGIEKVFKQRFGIDAELNTGSAATIVGKIRQESKSGAPYFDLHMGGGESMITGLLAEGILAPLEPAMMLAAKDNLTLDQYTKLENQSEEKVLKAREPATELARNLLD
jgi:hypothetical protein